MRVIFCGMAAGLIALGLPVDQLSAILLGAGLCLALIIVSEPKTK